MQSPYTEDYFLRGASLGLSNYTDYRWLEERTMAHARRLIEVLGIEKNDTVLDWGCARGYTVKALRRLGINAWGYDTSEWAVQNCDPEIKEFVHQKFPVTMGDPSQFDHVLVKDVAEHLEPVELIQMAHCLLDATARISIFIMVPLTERVGGQYVRKEDDMDVTHKIRWPLEDWMDFFRRRIPGESWVLTGSWHVPGLKPTSLSHPKSCGFIVLAKA